MKKEEGTVLHKCQQLPQSFFIKIMYYDNSSTQGTIQWMEKKRSLPFRSFLELLHLLEEALVDREAGLDLRSWKE
ncbi:MAG TPA: hypothetical protein GX711_09915 [Clostridia bacterium]|nr:hypothetical protein [Clostridia bacterium]